MTPKFAGIRTTCPYCGVGCGVIARRNADGTVEIKGDPEHPANFGRLCSKGSALGETLSLDERLLYPEIHGEKADWDTALDLVATRFAETIEIHGPDAVAFYVSGQLLTEDYYVANKLIKGFMGTANIDTNSRLCMASSVAGHKRAFGADTVPGCYEDLELADLIVLVGTNLAWCHPVLFQRIAAAKKSRPNMRVVLIDPRRTMTADIADLHLPIDSDGDSALFVGLLRHLVETGAIDRAYIAAHTDGFDDALDIAEAWTIDRVSEATGLGATDCFKFFDWFGKTEKSVTIYSQGVNQSAAGTDKVNAIINCHLATGRIGKPGMGPFSVTGQPNAMGGREVGGLANMLAAHMDFAQPGAVARVGEFWGATRMANKNGLKAVELFEAVEAGRIKALWIMATNPVDSLPEADRARKALEACDFVVVSDVSDRTDTIRYAHVKLPATAWGEKDGTVTNSERRISRQRAFLEPAGDARPDWWIVSEVARRMGHGEVFGYQSPADIFAEHAALSTLDNQGARDFDLMGLTGLTRAEYDRLPPVHWPVRNAPRSRMFSDGQYFTSNRRARFIAVAPPPSIRAVAGEFVLNTGRLRDQWHTMTRTAKSPRLSAHMAEPFAELHPEDAERLGVAPADLVRLANHHGEVVLRALITERQKKGHVFVPMHWTDQYSGKARVDALVTARTDPHSGQPASKSSRVSVSRAEMAWYGFALSLVRPVPEDLAYWSSARAENGWRTEIAGEQDPDDWVDLARRLLKLPDSVDLLAAHDDKRGRHSFAAYADGRLEAALFVDRLPVGVARQWAAGRLGHRFDLNQRAAILAGRPGADMPDPGATVCACFSVGVNTIVEAIRSGECLSVDAVGAALRAGTNCGSCRSEIQSLIDANCPVAAE